MNDIGLYLADGRTEGIVGNREYSELVAHARDILADIGQYTGKNHITKTDVEDYLKSETPKIQELLNLLRFGGGYGPRLDATIARTARVLAAINEFYQEHEDPLGKAYQTYSRYLAYAGTQLSIIKQSDPTHYLQRQAATRLQGDAARIVEESGYLNSAEHPSFRTLTPEANFPLLMKGLIRKIAPFFPPDMSLKMMRLKFSVYRSRHVRSMVTNFLGSWSKDMHSLWRAVQNLKDPVDKFNVAQAVLDYLAVYTGIDRQTDTQPFAAKPFSFQDFDLDVFAEGAVVKGRLNQDMTILQVKGAVREGRLVLTPQGEFFVEQAWQLFCKLWCPKGGTRIITLKELFVKLGELQIIPYGLGNYDDGFGHPGDLVMGDARANVAAQFLDMRKLHWQGRISNEFRIEAEAFQQLFMDDTRRDRILFGKRPVNPAWVAGDGLSGEIGSHLVRELTEAGIHSYAPATTRARSMVAAAASYLALQVDRLSRIPAVSDEPHIIRGAQIYVGAADILEPQRFAATVDQTMPKVGTGLMASLAYAAGHEQEPLLVTSGAVAVEKLAERARIAGVLRLQSPSTPNADKNDIAKFQGPWYVLGQWLKELATIIEAHAGLKVQLPRWPVVRTWSLEQSPLMRRVLDYAGQFGITTFLARAAGSQAFIPVLNLLNPSASVSDDPFGLVNDGGAMSHPKRLNSLLISAFIASLMPAKKPKKTVVARVEQVPNLKVVSDDGYTLSPNLMGLAGASRGGTFVASNPAEFEHVVSHLEGPLAAAISGDHSALTIFRGSHDFVGSRLAKMLMRISSFFNRDIFGAFELGVSLPGKKVRGSFMSSLIFGLCKPEEGDKITIRVGGNRTLREVAVVSANGDRVSFIKQPYGSIEQRISLNPDLKAKTATEDFVIQYIHDPILRRLVQQVPVNVNRGIVGNTYALPTEAGTFARDVDDVDMAGSWPTKLRTFASLQLGHPQDSVTYLAQRGAVDALKFLTDHQAETGIDVSSVTIHSLRFSGNATMDVASLVQPDRRLEIKQVYVAQKGRSSGEMVVADLITSNFDGTELNRVEIRIFVRLNEKIKGEEVVAVPFVKPQNWHKVPHGFDRLHTFMTAAELQTYATHVGDNNVIHLSDLAGRATMKSGAISPGFAIAAELEAFFRRRFRAARVENLEVVNQGDILPGKTYQIRAKPSNADAAIYEFQVVQREGRESKVRVYGRAKLALLPEKSMDEIDRARTVSIPAIVADNSPEPPLTLRGGEELLAEPVGTDEVAASPSETTDFDSGDESGSLSATVFGGGMTPTALVRRSATLSRTLLAR